MQGNVRNVLTIITPSDTQIGELKAALSNKEYQIISECAVSNISETQHVIPELNYGFVTSDEVEAIPITHQVAEHLESQHENEESWIVTKVSVFIGLVELRLYKTVSRDTSLATVQVIISLVIFLHVTKIWVTSRTFFWGLIIILSDIFPSFFFFNICYRLS